jgi:carboxylesterase type B
VIKSSLMMIFIVLFLFVLVGLVAGHGDPSITLDSGMKLIGTTHTQFDVDFFGAIRYAKPPIGDLRWAAPVPYEATEEDKKTSFDASKFGNICPQGKSGQHYCENYVCSEDCLFLNVFKPSANSAAASSDGSNNNSSSSSLPVALFIHGGSYTDGSSNIYPMTALLNYWENKAVIVTVNYRLGVLGFSGSNQLRQLDSTGSTGNQGILDQRMAMQWVHDNIQSFGGDPSRVMIFGESAGAGSVSVHLTMTNSFGLYSRALMESGSFSQWSMQTMETAEKSFSSFKEQTKCYNIADANAELKCLQSLTTTEVNTAQLALKAINYSPTADNVEASTHPWLVLNAGQANPVPILLGTNTDEGTHFIALPTDCTKKQLIDYWNMYQLDTDKLSELYLENSTYPQVDSNYTDYYFAGERSFGDNLFSCPARHASIELSKKQSNIFIYHFEHATGNAITVPHAGELLYMMHLFGGKHLNGESDELMADLIGTLWGNFLISKNGDPNESHVGIAKDLPTWPAYDVEHDVVLGLPQDDKLYNIYGLKKNECNYWNLRIDTNIKSQYPPVNAEQLGSKQ